jgi:hypothetical protein
VNERKLYFAARADFRKSSDVSDRPAKSALSYCVDLLIAAAVATMSSPSVGVTRARRFGPQKQKTRTKAGLREVADRITVLAAQIRPEAAMTLRTADLRAYANE